MSYEPYNPVDEYNKWMKDIVKKGQSNYEEIIKEKSSFEYQNTIFKEMADDIKQSQAKIENKLDSMIVENSKSEKENKSFAILTLIIAILTLITTIIGVLIQIF